MLDKIRSYLLVLCVIVIAVGLMAYVYVLSKGDGELFGGGSGNLPPTDFETLSYSIEDTGYLMCSTSTCSAADSDENSARFEVDAVTLRQLVADFTDADANIRTKNFDFRKSQFEFLERLPGQPFPSVISVRIVAVDTYTSELVLYSFKPVGKSMDGEHTERAARWISSLQALSKE
jgi:hypothetical protein